MSLSSLIIVLNFPSEKQHPSHKWEPDKCDATKMLFECHKNVNYFTSEIRKIKVTYFPRHNTKWWNTVKESYQWLKYWIGRGFKQFITQLSLTHWFIVSKPCITVFAFWVVLNEMRKLDLICNLTFNYFSATMQIIACTVRYYSHMSLSALSRQRSACDMYECNKLLMMLGKKRVFFSLFTGNSQALTRPALTCSGTAASSVGPEKPNTCICAASLHADSRLLWWYVVYVIINVDASVHLGFGSIFSTLDVWSWWPPTMF